MLAKTLNFLGSVLNLVIDTIYKIVRSMVIAFLVMFAFAIIFALVLVWLT
jgi:hypothetical protein